MKNSPCATSTATTNQAAIIALFRVFNRYVGNLAPMPGVFPDYPAPVVRDTDAGRDVQICHTGLKCAVIPSVFGRLS